MRKNILILLGLLGLAACNQKPAENLLGPADLEIVTSAGSKVIQLLFPSPRTISFHVEAPKTLPDANVTIELAVDLDLVSEYNRQHNTNYKTPPANICTFSKGTAILPRFNAKSTAGNFILNSAFLPDASEYLVPIVAGKINGKSDVNCKPTYIVCKRLDLEEPTNLNKSSWEVIYCNSEEGKGNYGGNASRAFVRETDRPYSAKGEGYTGWANDMLDGSYASIWAYDSKNVQTPYYFVIDMKKNYTIRQFKLFAERDGLMNDANNAAFKRQCAGATFEFATTLEGDGMGDKGGYGEANWFGAESFGADALKNLMSNEIYLSELRYARYIRFTYSACYSKSSETAPSANYTGGALAELDVYGYNKQINL